MRGSKLGLSGMHESYNELITWLKLIEPEEIEFLGRVLKFEAQSVLQKRELGLSLLVESGDRNSERLSALSHSRKVGGEVCRGLVLKVGFQKFEKLSIFQAQV